MKNYQKSNAKKINALFKKAIGGVNQSCTDGMIELLEAGVQYCFDAHDSRHHRHLEMGDSYGWLLLKDGREIRRKLFAEGAEAQGNANQALNEVKAKISTSNAGFMGIILAGMHPISYFNVKFEFYVMRRGMRDLTDVDFNRIFKPIQL